MTETSPLPDAAAPPVLPEGSPFAAPWDLDLGLPDFTGVRHEDIAPAVHAGMAAQRAQWEAVAADPARPTLANTVEPLERSGDLLERALTVLYCLTSATYCPDLDALEEELAPALAAHADAYRLDQRIYARFKALDEAVAAARQAGTTPVDADGAPIGPQAARLVHLAVEEFERGGIALTGADADRLRELNAGISKLMSRFSVLATRAMHAAGTANFTATPALATTRPHTARLELLARSTSRGLGGEYDTRALVLELVRLRAQRAALLGFEHHAALVAAGSAARTTQAVSTMLGRLAPPAMANARRDATVLAARMAADPLTLAGEVFGPADWPLYEAGLRREQFGVDDATLAPYLELWNVVEKGVFYAANRLYGLTFHERADLAAHMYDPSVRVWEVRDGAAAGPGQEAPVLGLFVGDYFAREGKSGGAWMNSLVNQSHLRGTRPVVINCANVPVPQEGGPALLTWDEVITCFHEFGHALHALLSDTYYPSASGANVPNDVVEFPSQVNESWALHPQVLASYAVHVDTGEPMPEELATRLRSQGSFGQGYATTEYLGAALLDQAWHTLAADQVPDDVAQVEVLERRALEESGIEVDLVPPRYRTTYFSHVFAGGYAAAYYAYIWSEVMDADTVAWFRADGQGGRDGDLGLNRQAGEAFRREFLSRGDSRDPLVSYRALTGRDPAIEPLLVRRGLA